MYLPLPFALEKLVWEFATLKGELIRKRKRLRRPKWVVVYCDVAPWYYMRIGNYEGYDLGPFFDIGSWAID